MLAEEVEWKTQAACLISKNDDWQLFYSESPNERRQAKKYCEECPVRKVCLTQALKDEEIWGVWGGCDETELRRVLSLNTSGKYIKRSRHPNCPNCKSKTNNLFIVTFSDLQRGQKFERVECENCSFNWGSRGSVLGVKAYWQEHRRSLKEKAKAENLARRH